MNFKKIIFIVGPTAVGKTEVALALSSKIKGEIISCDSMQVYKEIRISSNKPSPQQLRKVPHHLIDIISVKDGFDVARFNKLALVAIRDIHSRNRVPVVVGGTGLYMQILLDGIFESRLEDNEIRDDLKARAEKHGVEYLYNELKSKDPQAALKIHPNDLRRIIRALEISLSERRPISEIQKTRAGLWGKFPIYLFVLNRERKELYDRINKRVEEMFEEGIVEEIKNLKDVPAGHTASGIIGIKEIDGYLQGAYDLGKAKDLMKLYTRRYAKRQLTWFRKEKRAQWILIHKDDSLTKINSEILRKIESSHEK